MSIKADELKAKGIDEIVGTAVNDPFVMGAWNKASGSDAITMLADGNGDFAEAVGLTMDGSAFGLGKRGQRFSMVVNDGVVEQLNIEAPGDFKVSCGRTHDRAAVRVQSMWTQLVIKALVSGALIAAASEFARRSPGAWRPAGQPAAGFNPDHAVVVARYR